MYSKFVLINNIILLKFALCKKMKIISFMIIHFKVRQYEIVSSDLTLIGKPWSQFIVEIDFNLLSMQSP